MELHRVKNNPILTLDNLPPLKHNGTVYSPFYFPKSHFYKKSTPTPDNFPHIPWKTVPTQQTVLDK